MFISNIILYLQSKLLVMNVLIVNINQDFFKGLLPKIKFQPSTKNTCTFQIGEKKFKELLETLRARKINPYSVMSW